VGIRPANVYVCGCHIRNAGPTREEYLMYHLPGLLLDRRRRRCVVHTYEHIHKQAQTLEGLPVTCRAAHSELTPMIAAWSDHMFDSAEVAASLCPSNATNSNASSTSTAIYAIAGQHTSTADREGVGPRSGDPSPAAHCRFGEQGCAFCGTMLQICWLSSPAISPYKQVLVGVSVAKRAAVVTSGKSLNAFRGSPLGRWQVQHS
jgi:hypothetical protein